MLKFRKKKKEAAPEGEEAGGEKEEKAEQEAPAAEAAEGEASAEGEAPAEGDAKKKKRKLIIVGVAGLVMLLAVGGGAAFFFGGGEHAEEGGEGTEQAVEGKPVYFDLPQLLVNLNTGGKQTSFIKTTVTLELASETDVPIVQANLPRLIDNYNTLLREMRANDLYGSAGVYRLREEMLSRANKLLAPAKVKDVLFKELLVQ